VDWNEIFFMICPLLFIVSMVIFLFQRNLKLHVLCSIDFHLDLVLLTKGKHVAEIDIAEIIGIMKGENLVKSSG
jgi:hypothetical protein